MRIKPGVRSSLVLLRDNRNHIFSTRKDVALGKILLQHVELSDIIQNRFFFLKEINIWETAKLMSISPVSSLQF